MGSIEWESLEAEARFSPPTLGALLGCRSMAVMLLKVAHKMGLFARLRFRIVGRTDWCRAQSRAGWNAHRAVAEWRVAWTASSLEVASYVAARLHVGFFSCRVTSPPPGSLHGVPCARQMAQCCHSSAKLHEGASHLWATR